MYIKLSYVRHGTIQQSIITDKAVTVQHLYWREDADKEFNQVKVSGKSGGRDRS